VRWRGTLADPNELSLAVSAAMSFCFAIHASMRRKTRHLLLATVIGTVLYCVQLTGSRGGVLVLLAIFAVYFVRRYGARGLIIGLILGLPLLMFGGRSGEDAESSSLERIQALYDGVDFFKANPILGLGAGQFTENYFITAHNSYLLAAAELGFPGMLLWALLVYVSAKIPYQIATHPPTDMDPRLIPYGRALSTSFGGILIGIFFLSFIYQNLLFIYFGLSGALYGVAKQSSRQFTVRISRNEVLAVAGACMLIIVWLFVYTRYKGPQ
jgi:O-antigen ligase